MCIFNSTSKSMQSSRTLFENGEMAVTLPTAALPPPFKALGVSLYAKLLQLANSTFTTGQLLLFQPLQTPPQFAVTRCHKNCSGVGPSLSKLERQNPLCTWKMMLITLSLSSFADHLLRKAPRTASLSVNNTTRQALINLCHTLIAANTAITSSPG